MHKKIGIAGLGAMGSAVARALVEGIEGLAFAGASDLRPSSDFKIPLADFKTLASDCDLIVECLPAAVVSDLAGHVFAAGKDMILISTAALLNDPSIQARQRLSKSRIIVPSGALCGIDGVRAMTQSGIMSAQIISTKHPAGFRQAPYIAAMNIDLEKIETPQIIFSGNAREAAKAFPANVNVAATLTLACGLPAENVEVKIYADPAATANSHEIIVEGKAGTIHARVENRPDPANPKTSMLAAQSIISVLKGLNEPILIL